MPRPIGFSTGSLAPGNVRLALSMLKGQGVSAVELSALRDAELADLLSALPDADWSGFDYVSVHAPSQFNGTRESRVIEMLQPAFERRWPVVIHPDAVAEWQLWRELGDLVIVENMDSRKTDGRFVDELRRVFDRLPQARFCFDMGHAFQIDPTCRLLHALQDAFASRLGQIHLSVVNDRCGHEPLSPDFVDSLAALGRLVPLVVPVILETPVDQAQISRQLQLARQLF
jgi:hypothetical protein